MNSNKKLHLLLFFVSLLIAVLLQIVSIVNKTIVTDDEGVSYMDATGHEGLFLNSEKKDKWVDISEWKAYWNPDKALCLKTIRHDLAHDDIHPPLYFWVLHMWLLLTGVSVWSGAWLNLLIFILIYILLFRTGLKVLESFYASLAMTLVWGVSPAVMEYILESRQYTLLALFTIIFLLQILHILQNKELSYPYLAGLIAVATAGTLTHFYFALLIAGAALLIMAKCYKEKKWIVFFRFTAGMVISTGLFILIHPEFYLSFMRQQVQAKYISTRDFYDRVTLSAKAFNSYYFPGIFSKPGFGLTILLFLTAAYLLVFKRTIRRYAVENLTDHQKTGIFLFVFLSLAFVALYLSFVSPTHAMTAKYLSMIHLFIVLVTFILIRLFRENRQKFMLIGLCAWQLLTGCLFIYNEHKSYLALKARPVNEFAETGNLLVDMDERTIVPSILWYFPERDVNVYISCQDSMLTSIDSWKSGLGKSFTYISDLRFSNTQEKREKIIDEIIKSGYKLDKTELFFYNGGSQLYVFSR